MVREIRGSDLVLGDERDEGIGDERKKWQLIVVMVLVLRSIVLREEDRLLFPDIQGR